MGSACGPAGDAWRSEPAQARWRAGLAERVGASRQVLAIDVEPRFLSMLVSVGVPGDDLEPLAAAAADPGFRGFNFAQVAVWGRRPS